MDDIAKVSINDIVVVYSSGHGLMKKVGRLVWFRFWFGETVESGRIPVKHLHRPTPLLWGRLLRKCERC